MRLKYSSLRVTYYNLFYLNLIFDVWGLDICVSQKEL